MPKIIGNGLQPETSEPEPNMADSGQKPTSPTEPPEAIGDEKEKDSPPVEAGKIIGNG